MIEAAGLSLLWRQTRRGVAPFDLLPNLLAGAFSLLVLRATLLGQSWMAACGIIAAKARATVLTVDRWGPDAVTFRVKEDVVDRGSQDRLAAGACHARVD